MGTLPGAHGRGNGVGTTRGCGCRRGRPWSRRPCPGADDAGAALAGAGELDGGADLGLHGTLAELALVGQALGLVGGEVLELLLVGLAEVDGDMLDGGQQEQDVASQSSASSSPPRSLSMTAGTPL